MYQENASDQHNKALVDNSLIIKLPYAAPLLVQLELSEIATGGISLILENTDGSPSGFFSS